ncbi:MAG: glycogen debranching enzyme N-terminal domain-containing protein, partial [Desulfohalobiaceae bacterium]
MSRTGEEAASFQPRDREFGFDRKVLRDSWRSGSLEWLETNGLGGWAGSSLSGANTRRYHGLLVAAASPPRVRLVLLSKLEETILTNGSRYELGCNHFPGVIHPQGHLYLDRFTKDPFPRFEYEAGGVRLCKTVAAVRGKNTTLVQYKVQKAPGSFFLELRPLIAGRHIHGLVQANDQITRQGVFSNGSFRVTPYPGIPEIFVFVPGADFRPDPGWYFNFEYPAERERGLDFREDLFSHGSFRLTLEAGSKVTVAVSTSDPTVGDAGQHLARERQ